MDSDGTGRRGSWPMACAGPSVAARATPSARRRRRSCGVDTCPQRLPGRRGVRQGQQLPPVRRQRCHRPVQDRQATTRSQPGSWPRSGPARPARAPAVPSAWPLRPRRPPRRPVAGRTPARCAGKRPVIALTASKTETWVMAIARTATGVGGAREAMSAAHTLASVTASASRPDAPKKHHGERGQATGAESSVEIAHGRSPVRHVVPAREAWPRSRRRAGGNLTPFNHSAGSTGAGEVAERLNAPVLKTGVPARGPWVRIPPSPPINQRVAVTRSSFLAA